MGTRYPIPMEDTPAKRRWYRKYMREIDGMQGIRYDHTVADKYYEELLEDQWNFWVPVTQGRKVVGFFTMCSAPNCHPDTDYFLRDAYVRPQYRGNGDMKKALMRWLKLYPGKYNVIVHNNNYPAYHCWQKIFAEAGYEQFELRKLEEFEDVAGVTMFGFQPKEAA